MNFLYFERMNELYNGYVKGMGRDQLLYIKSIKNVEKT